MARLTVAFRVDASRVIGSGHVMRCLTLADALVASGARCHFIMREQSGSLESLVLERGHGVSMLPANAPLSSSVVLPGPAHTGWLGPDWQADASDSIAALADLSPDWLVVDHYALEAQWEARLSGHAGRVMVIDDLADREHACDLLLDQNLGRADADYDGLVPIGAKRLTGPGYALLRGEFARAREQSLARRAHGRLETILVSLGGVDKDNVTLDVVETLGDMDGLDGCRLLVVLGAASPHRSTVAERLERLSLPAELYVNTDEMAELMARSDLAIGAAGGTAWERCCLGLPTLMVVMADNQRAGADALHKAGAAVNLGEPSGVRKRLEAAVKQVSNAATLCIMARRAAAICDGLGAARVVAAMRGGDQ